LVQKYDVLKLYYSSKIGLIKIDILPDEMV
jgi:hypothetical protein